MVIAFLNGRSLLAAKVGCEFRFLLTACIVLLIPRALIGVVLRIRRRGYGVAQSDRFRKDDEGDGQETFSVQGLQSHAPPVRV